MVDIVGIGLYGCVVRLYILVTNFLYLQMSELLAPMLNSRANLTLCYFDIKCNRCGELMPNILDCHVSGIPFQIIC